jgi:RNA polymerase sigma-70 factor (ECF subfamily)
MAAAFAPDVTSLLLRWQNGDDCALASLTPLVYQELHRIAHRFMARERPEHTLETTALVNEAYVRLIDQSRVSWQSRGHFFAVSATLMRRVLVDYARTRLTAKRRGSETHEPLDEACAVSPPRAAILVAVDDALSELAKLDPRKSRIVELRFFGGLTVEETAVALAVSCATVEREWRTARAWLYREIGRNAEA